MSQQGRQRKMSRGEKVKEKGKDEEAKCERGRRKGGGVEGEGHILP